jgi:two-component system, sensor histidine kinase
VPAQRTKSGTAGRRAAPAGGAGVTEVALLLGDDTAAALAVEAEVGGVTAGALIRRILVDHLSTAAGTPVQGSCQAREAAARDFQLGAIAHELGNALTPIVLGAEVIRLAGPESPTGREACGRLGRQTSHLQQVLRGMLDLHRAGSGRLALASDRIDLGALAAAAAAAVEGVVRERGHRLTVRVAPGAGPLRGDPDRLEQVLVNLLTNAARYTNPGGEISLTAAREGTEVAIRVRDTGLGIPADLLPRVFDGAAPVDPSRGGLGIGLRLVRRLVELHGGSVAVTSGGSGTGSEFVVTLPAGE